MLKWSTLQPGTTFYFVFLHMGLLVGLMEKTAIHSTQKLDHITRGMTSQTCAVRFPRKSTANQQKLPQK